MDPNEGTTGLPNWLQWSESKEVLQLLAASSGLIKDDFRGDNYLCGTEDCFPYLVEADHVERVVEAL